MTRSPRDLRPLDVLGVPVRVRAADAEAAERLALCYAAFGDATGGTAPLAAELAGGDGRWTVRVDGRGETGAEDLTLAVRAFHHELMHGVMLRARRYFYVHAAVAELDGGAVVLPGLSRAGKSTVVLALVRAGARLLSDELLVFDPEARECLAFPRAIKVRDECVPYFGDLAGRFVGEGEGRFVPFDALGEGAVAARAPVRAVAVPRWQRSGSTELSAIRPGQALLELTSSALNFGTHGPASLDALTAVVRGARAFRLAWRDPGRAAELLLGALRDGEHR